MKFLYDFFPIILFYLFYKLQDIYWATGAAIVGTGLQVGISWVRHRKVEKMHLITFGLLVVLGGATILFHDAAFIKWKVSVVNWLFGVVFLGSQFIGGKTIAERMMGAAIQVPAEVWRRLNLGWALFFLGLGFLNLWVMYSVDEATWVNFKVYGLLGLTFLFVIAQSFYLARHVSEEKDPEPEQE